MKRIFATFLPTLFVCFAIALAACDTTYHPPLPPSIPVSWSIPNQTQGTGRSIVTGNIYVGINGSGPATAYDLTSRKAIWDSPVLNALIADNVATNGTLFALEAHRKGVYLLDLTGDQLAFIQAPTAPEPYLTGLRAHSTFQGQYLYVPFNRVLFKYDISDPRNPLEVWRKNMTHPISSLALSGNRIYLGRFHYKDYPNDQILTALNTDDGNVVWTSTTDRPGVYYDKGPILPTIASTWKIEVVGQQLVVATLAHDIQSFDINTGQRLWATDAIRETTTGCYSSSDYLIQDSIMYVSSLSDSCVFAFDLNTQKVKWMFDANPYGRMGTFYGRPAVHNGVVYAANGRLWALDAETGKPLGVSEEPDYAANDQTVQVVNNEVIVRGYDLTAFKTIR